MHSSKHTTGAGITIVFYIEARDAVFKQQIQVRSISQGFSHETPTRECSVRNAPYIILYLSVIVCLPLSWIH